MSDQENDTEITKSLAFTILTTHKTILFQGCIKDKKGGKNKSVLKLMLYDSNSLKFKIRFNYAHQ